MKNEEAERIRELFEEFYKEQLHKEMDQILEDPNCSVWFDGTNFELCRFRSDMKEKFIDIVCDEL